MPAKVSSDRKHTSASTAAAHDISENLASRIGSHKYEMWFGHTKLHVNGQRVELATDSQFVARWIDAHFADDLRGAVLETLGSKASIDVRVAPDMFGREDRSTRHADESSGDEAAAPSHGRSDDGPMRQQRRQFSTTGARRTRNRTGPSLRRLDEFVVGQSNRLAYSAACRLIEEQDALAVSPLFIHGDCGVGKTHLLQGICRRFVRLVGRSSQVRYVTGEQFTNEYIASIRNNNIESFRRRIRKLDLLAIDDVHFLSNKVRTQSEFLHTLDAIDLTGARVVLASDEHPRLIKRFSQALVSRFLSGMVVQIARPDRETRVAIIRQLAQTKDLPINEAAVDAVASRCIGSVRELEGAVTKLAALWSLTVELAGGEASPNGRPTPVSARDEVGLVLAEQLFNDHGWQPPTPVRISTVIDTVCQRLGIGRSDLMGSSRHRRVVLGRALVAYLGRDMTTHSYPEIARALGRSYHSTVHTAEQRLRRQMAQHKTIDLGDAHKPVSLKELVDQLRHEISRATTRA